VKSWGGGCGGGEERLIKKVHNRKIHVKKNHTTRRSSTKNAYELRKYAHGEPKDFYMPSRNSPPAFNWSVIPWKTQWSPSDANVVYICSRPPNPHDALNVLLTPLSYPLVCFLTL